jgi:GntR family transcriptional regulator
MAVERSIGAALEAPPDANILRATTLLSLRSVPLAITHSIFLHGDVPWRPGGRSGWTNLPSMLTLSQHVELAHFQLSAEAGQCGPFEADRFGVPHRSAVFPVLCTEHRWTAEDTRPFGELVGPRA